MFQFAYALPRQSSTVLCSKDNLCDYPGNLCFTVSQLNINHREANNKFMSANKALRQRSIYICLQYKA